MENVLSFQQIRRLRLKAQRLYPQSAGLSASPAQVLKEVCGVQAQDLPAGLLSINARSRGLHKAEVEQARQVERSIAWTWCLRGTLHLVASEDARWLVPLFGPGLIAGNRARMQELGWDDGRAELGIRLLLDALHDRADLTRPEIIALLEKNHMPHTGQAPIHLIYRAALEGLLCRGAERGKEPTFVLFERWLGATQPLPRQDALAELAVRYLSAYAPARPEDLASWSGLKLSDARLAWQLVEDRMKEVSCEAQAGTGPMWLLERQLPWLDELGGPSPVVHLLPRFDTLLLGYASRDWSLDPVFARRIHPGGGWIHPVLLVDGQVLGTWGIKYKKARLEIQVETFEKLASALVPPIEEKVIDLGRFLGEPAKLVFK